MNGIRVPQPFGHLWAWEMAPCVNWEGLSPDIESAARWSWTSVLQTLRTQLMVLLLQEPDRHPHTCYFLSLTSCWWPHPAPGCHPQSGR